MATTVTTRWRLEREFLLYAELGQWYFPPNPPAGAKVDILRPPEELVEETVEPMFNLPPTPSLILELYNCRDRKDVAGFLLRYHDAVEALFASVPYIEQLFPGSKAELSLDNSLSDGEDAVLIATIRSRTDPETAVERLETLDEVLWDGDIRADRLLFDVGPSL